MKILTYCHILLLTFTWAYTSKAQLVASFETSTQAALAVAQRPYTQSTQAEAHLLSGTECVSYSRASSLFQSSSTQAAAKRQPKLATKPGELSKLRCYTSGQAGRNLVIVQGLAPNGRLGSAATIFEVKPAL